MSIAICRLMGLALGPQLPPLEAESVAIIIFLFAYACLAQGYLMSGQGTRTLGQEAQTLQPRHGECKES